MNSYGKELILDLHDCNPKTFNRMSIKHFCDALCAQLKMIPADIHFWDYIDSPEDYEIDPDHLKGTSVIQFIRTSNITIHTLDVLKSVYLNIFSCKDFDTEMAGKSAKNFFEGVIVQKTEIVRI